MEKALRMTEASIVTNASCEVCGSEQPDTILNLGEHPLCDDLVAIGETRICAEYPIEIVFCDRCITAQQKYQVPKAVLFPATYHYRARFTADVLDGMSDLARACEARVGSLSGKLVLDVGCNDGSLLDRFRDLGGRTAGIEPTDAFRDAWQKGHPVINAFFDSQSAQHIIREHGVPDVITFTNVFAHIEDLPAMLSALKSLMGPETILVIENHYLGAVLDRFQFDTFYHEHPRTYSVTSFFRIADTLGATLQEVSFPKRYGGNVRIFIGPDTGSPATGESSLQAVLDRERDFGARLAAMQQEVTKWRLAMADRVADLVRQHGPLPAKAFPARAAILIKLLGVDHESIDAVYEKPGSMKIGHYVPGTRIPIRSDDEFWSQCGQAPVVLNLAWHIGAEIRSYLGANGYHGDVVDILQPPASTI